jgi:glyoxylase-like metal-dependent hydrolase (beta-lactamase superfamily II)
MKLHIVEGYIQSIYLAEYPDKLLLLDGACRADVNTICSYIVDTLQRPLQDLKLVVCTHMHPDHAGAAAKLRQLTQCEIAVPKSENHWYRGVDGWLMYITDMLLAKWVAKRIGKKAKWLWYQDKFKADHPLEDLQTLPYFNDWQVIYTQGHTDRDISLLHNESNKIYVADLIVKVKGKFTSPFPVFYPNRYKKSLQRLKELNVDGIYMAHGTEIHLSPQEFEDLQNQAPSEPMTHWRSVKYKFKKAIGLHPKR